MAKEDIGNFKLSNEPQCQWLPLCRETFPTAFYHLENLFPNWNDFPELHQVKFMAWDEEIVNDTDGQYVRTVIADCNEITTIFGSNRGIDSQKVRLHSYRMM